ncbi:MAG: hypothetical protein AB3N06_04825 [Erythrobacter sp.]
MLEDVAAINRLIAEAYAVISGPAGAARDWDAMRAMYLPGAQMTAIRPGGTEVYTVEEYIAGKRGFLTDNGFSESALVNRIEVFGHMAHAWSSYSGDWTEPDGTVGSTRGINSFQFRRDETGAWRIHSLLWQVETPQIPLPADMKAL